MFLCNDSEDLIRSGDTVSSADDRHRGPRLPHPSDHPEHYFFGMDYDKIAACDILETYPGVGPFKTVMEPRIDSHYAYNFVVPNDNYVTHSAVVLWETYKRVQAHFAWQ